MRRFKRAAIVGATVLALGGGATAGVAQAEAQGKPEQGKDIVKPGDFGDCMKYGKNLKKLGLIVDFACFENPNGTFSLTPYYPN